MPFKTFAAVFRERATVDERSFGRRVSSFDVYLDIPNGSSRNLKKFCAMRFSGNPTFDKFADV